MRLPLLAALILTVPVMFLFFRSIRRRSRPSTPAPSAPTPQTTSQ